MLLALLLACSSPSPPDPGWVAFVSGEGVLTLVRPDGTGRRQVATGPDPAFPGPPDPRGELVLAVSSTAAPPLRQRLLAVPVGGGPVTVLDGPHHQVKRPAWSPDGAFVVYESDARGRHDLYRVPRQGGAPSRLTDDGEGFDPSVAPPGVVAFVSSTSGDAELYVTGAEGTRPLVVHPGEDAAPRWSPDGASLAWIRRAGPRGAAWVAAADGTSPRPILPADTSDHGALAWSPDGTRVALTVRDGTDVAVLVVEVARGAVLARLGGPGVDEQPTWSPDGTRVVWSGAAPGQPPDLWIASADGADPRVLVDTGAADWLPRWIPPARP